MVEWRNSRTSGHDVGDPPTMAPRGWSEPSEPSEETRASSLKQCLSSVQPALTSQNLSCSALLSAPKGAPRAPRQERVQGEGQLVPPPADGGGLEAHPPAARSSGEI